jgi:hypothetical protein
MPLWKLTPTNLSDPLWRSSRHSGPAVVRAASDGAARRISAATFWAGDAAWTGGHDPWTSPALVKAEPLEDARFDERGRSEVLDPAA